MNRVGCGRDLYPDGVRMDAFPDLFVEKQDAEQLLPFFESKEYDRSRKVKFTA
jgi:hypothetical protein